MTQPDRILPGVAMMIGFCAIAPLIDVCAKLATDAIPAAQVTLARFAVQGAVMVPIMLALRLSWALSRRALWLTFLRALVLIASTFTFISAVHVMPIADALAIAFVEPFIILLVGKFFMAEQVGPRRLGAAVVGFGGALMVIQPSFAAYGLAALFPLGTAVSFAFYILITRQLSRLSHPIAMQTHTATFATVLLLPILWLSDGSAVHWLDPVWPQGIFWLWLVGVGVAAAVSHMFITYALQYAPSSTLAPLHYLEIVSAVALGYLVFGDFPDAMTWAGIVVICASGLYVIYRERVTLNAVRATVPPLVH